MLVVPIQRHKENYLLVPRQWRQPLKNMSTYGMSLIFKEKNYINFCYKLLKKFSFG